MYYIIPNKGKYESLKIIVWHMDLLFLRLFYVTQRPISLLGESELIYGLSSAHKCCQHPRCSRKTKTTPA